MKKNTLILAAAGAIATAGAASAAGLLQLDLNALQSQARDTNDASVAFGGLSHTGSILLTSGVNSSFADILLNGVGQNIAPNQLLSFTGEIDLVNGDVTGGSLMLTIVGGDTFTSDIQGGFGQVVNQVLPGGVMGFSIDGLLFNSVFSDSMFAGADISAWTSLQPLNGSFINFAFNPNANGFDDDTNLDVFLLAVIPSPLAGSMAGLGLMGLAARRRRA